MSDFSLSEDQQDIRLLAEVGEGNRESFRKLYDRFAGVLYSTAYKVLNDQTEASDILQESFIQIWNKAGTYDSERGRPLTWALTLTRNKAIDRLRSIQRRTRLKDELEKETGIFEAHQGSDASDLVYTLEKSNQVREAVSQLSKEQRTAIELAFFSGLTQNEIAVRLDLPLGTVKARVRRGMMKLRELIGDRP